MKITMKYPVGSPAEIAKLPPLAEYTGKNPVYVELLDKKIRTTDVEKLFPGEEWAAFLVEDDEGQQWYPWKGVTPEAYDEHGARVVPPVLPPMVFGPDAMSTADLGGMGYTDAILDKMAQELLGETWKPDRVGPSDARRAMWDRVMAAAYALPAAP